MVGLELEYARPTPTSTAIGILSLYQQLVVAACCTWGWGSHRVIQFWFWTPLDPVQVYPGE